MFSRATFLSAFRALRETDGITVGSLYKPRKPVRARKLPAGPPALSHSPPYPDNLMAGIMNKALAAYANEAPPLMRMETVMVNDLASGRCPLTKPETDTLLYALALAQLRVLHARGRDVVIAEGVAEFRVRLVDALRPLILEHHGDIDYVELRALVPALHDEIVRIEDRILTKHANEFSREDLEGELTQKELVLVLGGGGGSGYVYMGAFVAFEEMGITPSYMVGSSMGSIMAVIRGLSRTFTVDFGLDLIRSLRWRDVFRFMSMESRYGLPATMRLHLYDAMGPHFQREGAALRLDQLAIPTEIIVAGIKKGGLPHDISYYEQMLDLSGKSGPMQILAFRRRIGRIYDTLREFLNTPSILHEIVVGRDELTQSFDAIDAMGFSSAIPGVIHYDVAREDMRMHSMIQSVLNRWNLLRLIDGGVVANVPARSAWIGVQEGKIKRRNTFILALDSFAPSFNSNLLFAPIQHLVQQNVKRDRPYAHFVKAFPDVLSPLNLVPRYEKVIQATVKGKRAMERDMPFVKKMLEPISSPRHYREQGVVFSGGRRVVI
jgi:predicted acylesterase/phospholipase RssA